MSNVILFPHGEDPTLEQQVPTENGEWICPVCTELFQSNRISAKNIQSLHFQFSPNCAKILQAWDEFQKIPQIIQSHAYHCDNCGETHRGWSKFSTHRDSCLNKSLKESKKKEKAPDIIALKVEAFLTAKPQATDTEIAEALAMPRTTIVDAHKRLMRGKSVGT